MWRIRQLQAMPVFRDAKGGFQMYHQVSRMAVEICKKIKKKHLGISIFNRLRGSPFG
jgi:hypothetical protein